MKPDLVSTRRWLVPLGTHSVGMAERGKAVGAAVIRLAIAVALVRAGREAGVGAVVGAVRLVRATAVVVPVEIP